MNNYRLEHKGILLYLEFLIEYSVVKKYADKNNISDAPMNDEELEYCTNDVIGLIEALHNMFEAV